VTNRGSEVHSAPKLARSLQEAAAASELPVLAGLPEDSDVAAGAGFGLLSEVAGAAASPSALESLTAALRLLLSVTYQPLPLKTTGGAWSTRLAMPLRHSSHLCVVSASKPWRRSYVDLHFGQWYS
jgi:hypothetical protein